MFPGVRLLGRDVLICFETGGSADLSLSTAHGEPRLSGRPWCGDTSVAPASGPELWFRRSGQAGVRFSFRDQLRPDGPDVISRLQARGLKFEILLGDRIEVVGRTA